MNPNTPVPKVIASSLAAVSATLLSLALEQLGYTLDPSVCLAISTIAVFVAGYYAPRETQQIDTLASELARLFKLNQPGVAEPYSRDSLQKALKQVLAEPTQLFSLITGDGSIALRHIISKTRQLF